MAELELIGTVQPFEKEYSRKDGSRVPVLIGGTMFEEDRNQGVSFVTRSRGKARRGGCIFGGGGEWMSGKG
jgi:hypothetical protein